MIFLVACGALTTEDDACVARPPHTSHSLSATPATTAEMTTTRMPRREVSRKDVENAGTETINPVIDGGGASSGRRAPARPSGRDASGRHGEERGASGRRAPERSSGRDTAERDASGRRGEERGASGRRAPERASGRRGEERDASGRRAEQRSSKQPKPQKSLRNWLEGND
jgi:hypothetical protein